MADTVKVASSGHSAYYTVELKCHVAIFGFQRFYLYAYMGAYVYRVYTKLLKTSNGGKFDLHVT
jgi:hypothetical protein